MTDYRSPPTMNLWNDENSSVMEAFMSSSDLSSLLLPPPQQQQPPPPPPFIQESLQHRLQALIEGARESWTYAIFWQCSYDYSNGLTLLGWGDGYYQGDEDKGKAIKATSFEQQQHRKKVFRELISLISGPSASADEAVDEEVTDTEWFFLISMTQHFVSGTGLPGQAFFNSNPVWVAGPDRLLGSGCDRARQGQSFGIQTIVCIPSANGVVELGSTELIFQNTDLMSKVKEVFNFSNSSGDVAGSWPLSSADQGENDPSSSAGGIEIRDSVNTAATATVANNKTVPVVSNPGSSSVVTEAQKNPQQDQGFVLRGIEFLELV